MGKVGIPNLEEEALLWKDGSAFVFGVDEAGRGCLAGPVCAGVSAWAPFSPVFGLPVAVRDSKVMTEPQREGAFAPVQQYSLAWGVGFASAQEIDRWNILRATHLAIARALEAAFAKLAALGLSPWQQASFLTDGSHSMVKQCLFFLSVGDYQGEFPCLQRLRGQRFVERCVVKGDSKVFSIACGSVLAKVSRDRYMLELDRQYPTYEFAAHKGYSTAKHVENLRKAGPCLEHRRSFSPVSETLLLFP